MVLLDRDIYTWYVIQIGLLVWVKSSTAWWIYPSKWVRYGIWCNWGCWFLWASMFNPDRLFEINWWTVSLECLVILTRDPVFISLGMFSTVKGAFYHITCFRRVEMTVSSSSFAILIFLYLSYIIVQEACDATHLIKSMTLSFALALPSLVDGIRVSELYIIFINQKEKDTLRNFCLGQCLVITAADHGYYYFWRPTVCIKPLSVR